MFIRTPLSEITVYRVEKYLNHFELRVDPGGPSWETQMVTKLRSNESGTP